MFNKKTDYKRYVDFKSKVQNKVINKLRVCAVIYA